MFKLFRNGGRPGNKDVSSDKRGSVPLELSPEDLVERVATLLRKYRSVYGGSEDINEERKEGEKRACVGDVREYNLSKYQYATKIQFDGTLPDGRDYEIEIKRNNQLLPTGITDISKKINVKFFSVKGAKICFEADYSGVTDFVSVNSIHFSAENKDDETIKVLDYANRTYQEIKADLEQKVPGLLELAYNSKIIPRDKGIDELF